MKNNETAKKNTVNLFTLETRANMKEMLPHNTFYRHRRELLSFGIDINFYCDSPDSNNVVPLIRTLEAKPVEIPLWIYEKGFIFDYNRISHASSWH